MVGENVQEYPVQKELGVAMHAPSWRRGRRRVRLVSLARGSVVDERPFAAVILVADDKVEGCEHGREKSLELQEGMTLVGSPVRSSERGSLGLVRQGKVLVIVIRSSLIGACSSPKKKKKKRTSGTPLYPSGRA